MRNMIGLLRTAAGLLALLLLLVITTLASADTGQEQDLPVNVSKADLKLAVTEAGRAYLHLNDLSLLGLGLILTDSGGLIDQRPHYFKARARAQDGELYRLQATGTLTSRTGIVFDFVEQMQFDETGLTVSYEVLPRTDCFIELLRLTITIPVDIFGGRRVVALDEQATSHVWALPAEQGDAVLGSGPMTRVAVEFGEDNAVEVDEIRGASATFLWDMRHWDLPWYSLNFRFGAGELKAGEARRLSVRVSTRHALRAPALLAMVDRARIEREAHFLPDLRAKFRGTVLPLAPFDFANANWRKLREHGDGLERVIPYLHQVCETIDMDPGSETFGYMDFHWRSGIAPDNATFVETMQPLACVWSTPGGLTATGVSLRRAEHEVRVLFDRPVALEIDPSAYREPSPYSNAAGIAIARLSVRLPDDGALHYTVARTR